MARGIGKRIPMVLLGGLSHVSGYESNRHPYGYCQLHRAFSSSDVGIFCMGPALGARRQVAGDVLYGSNILGIVVTFP